jgi:DNA-binding transcriptional regulator YhcF (GntR family)
VDKAFSARELAATLAVSPRTVNRLLKEAVAKELVEQSGKGPATRFRVKRRQAA